MKKYGFNFLLSFVMIGIGIGIIDNKTISGSKGSPDLYLGNWSYLVGGIFVIYGIYVILLSIKD